MKKSKKNIIDCPQWVGSGLSGHPMTFHYGNMLSFTSGRDRPEAAGRLSMNFERDREIGFMRIYCECGSAIVDSTDGTPHKAHLIPDQNYLQQWDNLDEVFDAVANGQLSSEAAAMRARHIVLVHSRGIWQCGACGRLYLDGRDGNLQCFTPSTPERDKESLRAA